MLTPVRGAALVLASGLVFSFGGLAFRSTDDITPWQYLFFRGLGMLLVACALLGWTQRADLGRVIRGIGPSHLLAGVALGVINAAFIVALDHATVAFVLVLQTLAPLTAAWFSWMLLRERVSGAVLVATAVSLVGVAIMVSATLTDDLSAGGLVAILIPVGFGLYATLIRRAGEVDPMVPVVLGGIVLLASSLAVMAAVDGFDVSARDGLIGVFAGSCLLALPLGLFNLGQRVVPAPETALLLMAEVVLAPLWVWVFVDERPEATTFIGGGIILAAVSGLLARRLKAARS